MSKEEQFYFDWITKNVKTDLYPDMKDYVWKLARTLLSQHHSGASHELAMHYFVQMAKAFSQSTNPDQR